MGLLTVRVDKVLHGEISGTVLIRYFRAEQALTKESIFAVDRDREFGEKGYKWNAQRWPRELSQYDKFISALQGIGEPVTVWDVGALACGMDFFYPYDRSLEEQIVTVAQKGVPLSIVEQRYERYAQDVGTPIEKPIEYAD